MPLEIADTLIERIRIIDDEQAVREVYTYIVEDLELEPDPVEGPLPSLEVFVDETVGAADAAICDHKLRIRNYAHFDGAETAAMLYKQGFPAILCTKWELASLDEIRRFRRFIPVMVRPDELDPDTMVKGFRQCLEEFKGMFEPGRRSWRTLVRVEEFDAEQRNVYVIVPAWDPNEVIRLMARDLPQEIVDRIGEEIRFHAHINLGAEGNEDLFFENWEM